MTSKDGASGEAGSFQLTLALDEAGARRTADLLSELLWPPANAVGLRKSENGRWLVEAFFSERPADELIGRFLRETCALAKEPSFQIEEIADTDWVTHSQAARPPIRAGRFLVHGKHDRTRVGRSRWSIEIEAGQAFGTGHHGSTAGCLMALDRLLRRPARRRCLDLGTGTGVLAIAMAKSGCKRVLASDSDRLAVAAAAHAIRQNGVKAQVRTLQANGLKYREIRSNGPYDLVTANILAGPLAGFAGALAQHVRPGGMVVLSGLLCHQARAVCGRYRACGFVLHARIQLDDWATLVLQRH